MKVIIPTRGCLVLALVTILFCLPSNISAQCSGCAEATQELEECDSNGNNVESFNLESVTITSGNSRGYWMNCAGGTLMDTISTDPTDYDSGDGIVYVQEFDPSDACVRIIQVTLDVNNPTVSVSADEENICDGEMAVITALAPDADLEATYTWTVPGGFTNPGDVSVFSTGVDGNYSVVVNDEACTDSDNVNINVVNLTVTISPTSGDICAGPVTLTGTISGGSGGRSYSWNVPAGHSGSTTNQTISANAPGTYSLVGTRGDCTKTSDDVLITDASFTVSINPSGGNICEGDGSNNEITLTADVSNGPSGATYSWSSPPGGPSSSSSTIDADVAGAYTVTVMKNGCSETSPAVTILDKSISTVALAKTDVSCKDADDGTVTVTVTPSESDPGRLYNFQLSGPTPKTANGVTSPHTFTMLDNGAYTATATNSISPSCTKSSSGSVTVNPGRDLTMVLTKTDPTTFGGSDGEIDVNTSGGTSTYKWNYSRAVPPGTANGTDSNGNFDILMLIAGTYTITVTDNEGSPGPKCKVVGNTTLNAVVCNLSLSSVAGNAPNCNGDDGTITGMVSGAIGAYTITYSGSGGTVNKNGNSFTISGLATGNYSVSVSDTGGCSDSQGGITIVNPPPVSYLAVESSKTCGGLSSGSISVNSIMNGTTPYTVSWTGPVSNSQSTSANSLNIPLLSAGSYTISVSDANNCSGGTKQVTVGTFPAVQVEIDGDDVFCAGAGSGTLFTTPAGFSMYQWDDSNNTTSATLTIPNPGPTTKAYAVTVTDGNGCKGVDQFQVLGLSPISITLNAGASKTSVTCSSDCDGRIDINITGGDGNYNYTWTGPSTNESTADIDDLCTGTYTLNVVDGAGCTATFSQAVSTPDEIQASAFATEVSCNGESDGVITVQAQGGTAPLEYKWSSPIPSNQTSSIVSGLSAGSYTVTITDFNDCFVTRTVNVPEPSAVIGNIAPLNPEVCIGNEIALTASGGTSYQWSNGAGNTPSVTVQPMVNTTYTVTVTDANTKGCTTTTSVSVQVNDLPTVDIQVSETSGNINNDALICQGSDITLTATGGTIYNWTGGNPNPYKFSPAPGTASYVVTVTDANGCVKTKEQSVTVNLNPKANFTYIQPTTLIVEDDQNIRNESTAECGDLVSCLWEIDQNPNMTECDIVSARFSTQGLKNVKLTVENSCGCKDDFSNVLDIGASDQCAILNFVLNDSEPTACVSQNVPFLRDARASGGECVLAPPSYTVTRNGIQMTLGNQFDIFPNHFTFSEVGLYEVTLTISDGACGCSKSQTRTIDVLAPPDISFAADNPIQGCQGEILNIRFGQFDQGDKVTVLFENGMTQPYENNNFDFAPVGTGKTTLKIISVDIGTCEVPVTGEELEIDILPEFKIVSEEETNCDDDFKFSYTVVVDGGDASAPLVAEGVSGGLISGNVFKLNGLLPNTVYEFNLSRGNACDSIPIRIFKIQCDCFFDLGTNLSNGLKSCEDEIFDISNIFTTQTDSSEYDRVTDTFVYVLHLSGGGLTLGEVKKVLPANATTLDNDFPGFFTNVTYRLSAVGIKKASLIEDIDLNNLSTLTGKGKDDCLSVVNGIPIEWSGVPNPEIGTLDGGNEICKNAYDFMVFSKNTQDGSTPDFEVIGLTEENLSRYGFMDTVFIYFEDNGQDSFEIVLTESINDTDFDGVQFTCEAKDTSTVYVKDGPGAPPLSDILLWPGNILASTADPGTTCFEWRFSRQGQLSQILGEEKYYYADVDIDFSITKDIYFVDTYFCDNPDCVTRIFFNNDGPIPGLNYKDETTFQYLVKPNPNDGSFVVSLFSDEKSTYSFEFLDVTGKIIHSEVKSLEQSVNTIDFDMTNLPKGLYFLRILDRETKTYSIDKVIIN